MALHKVIEVLAYSDKSWEDAIQKSVSEASKTLHNIESVYVEDFSSKIENNKIVQYRVNAKITFMIE